LNTSIRLRYTLTPCLSNRGKIIVRIKTGKGPGKKKGKGSVITYFSKIKKENEHDGHFTIHKFHKKKEEITKIDFKRYLYPVLDRILNYMEQQ